MRPACPLCKGLKRGEFSLFTKLFGLSAGGP